ncbi:MAG: NADP-reducing hydrogenase subunit HndA [Elusimicrobia bacterium ADurb.Bin231]|nr:MAG: NADP-reducing hydrogenase subunit HndA [Elusimicrobia bacterium ADurb.Bin231]
MEKKSVLERLHETQDKEKEKNYISEQKASELLKENSDSLSHIYGVATFYTMLSVKPRGRYIIRICRNLACHLENADSVAEELKNLLGIGFGETTTDGKFTLEESSCLGMCSVAPAMMINDEPYGNLTPEKVKDIIESLKAGSKK